VKKTKKVAYQNIFFLRLHILINNINKHIHFLRNTNNLKPKHIILIGCFNIYEKMSHYSKGKGAKNSSYFNCWASFPSHAFLQLRHGERERAQKYFLCVLFADPDWELVSLPPLRSALPATLAALPTSQSASR